MRRREHRHPALETAVFAAAILLFVFVARELWRRRPAEAVVPVRTIARPIELIPDRPIGPVAAKPVPRTETSVKSVPSIKLTRVSRRRKTEPVPVPK